MYNPLHMKKLILLSVLFSVIFISCKKEERFISGNKAPNYYGIPTIKVKNYVNRIFIDLIGREPIDTEMDSVVALFEANNLNYQTRIELIQNMQEDTINQPNGDNFRQLFYYTIYGQQKARFLEGVPDSEISQELGIKSSAAYRDSVGGNMIGYQYNTQQAKIYEDLLSSGEELKNDSIDFNEMCRRMCTNSIYDKINMNAFNYINAVFDNTLYRFPTQDEFTASYNMVEYDLSDLLFATPGSNKYDFANIVMHNPEFNDGTITWIYRAYLNRFPTTQELYHYSLHFQLNNDLEYVIREIMKTDEYANF